jgi:hypothetical protein
MATATAQRRFPASTGGIAPMTAAASIVTAPGPKDPKSAARSRRYRQNQKTALAATERPRVTVSTLDMVKLAGRVHGGDLTVSAADADLASRLVLALVRMLPPESAIEI